MCGIVAVLRAPSGRPSPRCSDLIEELTRALGLVEPLRADAPGLAEALTVTAEAVERVDHALRGTPGVRALLGDPSGRLGIAHRADALETVVLGLEAALDAGPATIGAAELEALNSALVRTKDAVWAVRRDRLHTAEAVGDLSHACTGSAAIEALTSVQVALAAIDRLEVRGRDSAGLHVLVSGHGIDLGDEAVRRLVDGRTHDPLFGTGSVRVVGDSLAIVYKAAAEIGELGDNTAALRAAIRADSLLALALAPDDARVAVLGHTRWASVGVISEANAHPLNHEEPGRADGPYVAAALNGDVDNHADLRALEQLEFPAGITTDAKVIPALVSRRVAAGAELDEAFRTTVASLEGSVAIAAVAADTPEQLLLAQRGSGQALYVGLADDAFIVASEPYGLVEETATYLRLDGETALDPDRPDSTRGQIAVLDAAAAGTLEGIRRFGYDGTALPLRATELATAEITTRDIDRGDFPHFLLKEITEAPTSFRKTLRGRVVSGDDGRLRVALPEDALPGAVVAALADGTIRRVLAIGQGTAAVAGQSFVAALTGLLEGTDNRVAVSALPATELSGFGLRDDMSDTLVVAVSQSGTTTDTNRTVDLVRARGARVLSIVNRRNSDLVDKSDGVLFTSDGRDVEMSVASTKAFYSQVAAGFLLAIGIADASGIATSASTHELLAALRVLPDAMQQVVDRRHTIGPVAQRNAPFHRDWTVVGNGVNRIAAQELRIKISELCYKSISCDATEDKKHIDLSAEPMIVVCAAGLTGSTADDVAKEVAIYRAHRATPIVIATEGDDRFTAVERILVPAVHPRLAYLLVAVAGHLFGYEAALAIDESARPLREARAAIETAVAGSEPGASDLLDRLAAGIEVPATRFFELLRAGGYDGHLEASVASRVGSLLRYATGIAPLEAYSIEHGKVGTPSVIVEDLTAALTAGIEQLTRPVDAIKHQAKTVTVGISRSDETLLQVPLVREVLGAGVARDSLSYRALRTLVALDPAIDRVTGFTRYAIEGDVDGNAASIHITDRGGVAVGIPSRTDRDTRLLGTKHRVARQQAVTANRSLYDGRTMVLVPEVKGTQTTGITLLHVTFRDQLAAGVARAVLQGYQSRYDALREAITETDPVFDESRLADFPIVDLLTDPVNLLADRWHS